MNLTLNNQLISIIKDYNINKAYVFGSFARNEETKESDIDLLIDTKDSRINSLFDLGAMYEDLKKLTKRDIDLLTLDSLNENSLDSDSDILTNNIKKDMVLLYERER